LADNVAVGAAGGGGGGAGGGGVGFFEHALTTTIIASVTTIKAHFIELRFTYSSSSEDSLDLRCAGLPAAEYVSKLSAAQPLESFTTLRSYCCEHWPNLNKSLFSSKL
jgi:hypothetical protein